LVKVSPSKNFGKYKKRKKIIFTQESYTTIDVRERSTSRKERCDGEIKIKISLNTFEMCNQIVRYF